MPVNEKAANEPTPLEGELEVLMRRYQAAEPEAASELVRRVSPQIFRVYMAQVRDRDRAEDLLQEFWLRLHKARQTYRLGEPVLPWMYSIARRVQIDHFRRNRRARLHEVATDQVPEIADQGTTGAATVGNDLSDLLMTLPAGQREAVLLMKVGGLSLQEVAIATNSTVGAVKQKAHRAYQSLRKVFGQES